jgi:hypothetical protein
MLPSYTDPFDIAWHFTLTQEIPGWTEALVMDPDVQAGLVDTPAQRAKVGYIDHPGYPAARRKFGLYQGIFPGLDFKTLTFTAARSALLSGHWAAVSAQPQALATMLLDVSLLHGKSVLPYLLTGVDLGGDALEALTTLHDNLTAYIMDVTGASSERRGRRVEWLSRADALLAYAAQLA